MAVPLLDLGDAVGLGDDAALGEAGGVETEPHRPAEVARALDERLLLLHRRDDRRRRLRVELRRRGPLDAGDVPRILDHHALEAEADPQRGHLTLARPPDRPDLALDATHAEPARDEDGVDPAEGLLR